MPRFRGQDKVNLAERGQTVCWKRKAKKERTNKMKKLMIAAAAVALAGVTFADCDEPVECAYAYRVKLAGKTVKGKVAKSGSIKTCDLETNCWAKPASYRVAGYIYGATTKDGEDDCAECSCNAFDAFETIFWNENKKEVKFDSVALDTFDILRNSGAKNKAQIAWKFDDLNLAGFGVYNPNTQKLKSASGFFAGTLAAPECETYDGATCEYGSEIAKVFTLCDLATAKDAEKAIAFGRWSMTYKADKVAAYSKTGDTNVFKPAAFKAIQ